MTDIERKLAKKLEDLFIEAMMGGPVRKKPQIALRLRGSSFETVEIDDAGNVIEPFPRCCCGTVVHAPNCKFWLTCT
jgi:hypothetical protein